MKLLSIITITLLAGVVNIQAGSLQITTETLEDFHLEKAQDWIRSNPLRLQKGEKITFPALEVDNLVREQDGEIYLDNSTPRPGLALIGFEDVNGKEQIYRGKGSNGQLLGELTPKTKNILVAKWPPGAQSVTVYLAKKNTREKLKGWEEAQRKFENNLGSK